MWNDEKKRVTVQLPPELQQRLADLARQFHRTLPSQMIYMVERELERIDANESTEEARKSLKVER